jgi:hypothetical protein
MFMLAPLSCVARPKWTAVWPNGHFPAGRKDASIGANAAQLRCRGSDRLTADEYPKKRNGNQHEEVIVTRHDGVMRITMNRPTRKNALTAAHMLTGNAVEEVELRTKTGARCRW